MAEGYGEGIYETRVCEPFSVGNNHFTRKGETLYAFHLYKDEHESVKEEMYVPVQYHFLQIDLVGGQENLCYRKVDGGIIVQMPEVERSVQAPIAHVFRMK